MKKNIPIAIFLLMIISLKSYSEVKLNSFPSAKATIFLDFDGQTVAGTSWNSNGPLFCAPSGMTDDQITDVFNRVAEDYRPFNINITTDSTVFLAAPLNQRIRVIITPTSNWCQGVAGVTFTGSFIWGDDTPCFVFSDRLVYNSKYVAECCTHESGHAVGLSHQAAYNGTCQLVSTYNQGQGTGQTSWAPVMGNSYYKNLSGWNNGPTPNGCTADQDNLSIITSRNGFTYRTDDHSDDPEVNPTIIDISKVQFAADGIITTNTDRDAFKIKLPKDGVLQLNATPFSVGANNEGADLDVEITLLNAKREVVKVYNPEEKLDVTIDTTLMAGDYYILVQGSGNANTTNYGSLGSYRVSGVFSPLTVLPLSQVLLSGDTNNGNHNLTWSIISDVAVKNLSIESSLDGSLFTTLTSPASNVTNFNYSPLLKQGIFYRLKSVMNDGQIAFSNVLFLKPVEVSNNQFKVSTLINSEITVNAPQNYNYLLADMSGRVLKTGKALAGLGNIDMSNSPNGIYFLQIICNSQRITQRIVKL
ncbi:MAG TPA: zinc-dependent metalloprotease [Hanamia sp.]